MADTAQAGVRRPTRPRRQRNSLWRLLRANLYDLRLLLRQSALGLVGFGVVALAGTLYLQLTFHERFLAGLYETLQLLIFQNSRSLPDDWLGQALFFLIPLLGLLFAAQSAINFGRFLLNKSSRPQAWQIALASTYRHHVIVGGLGRVGLRVVTQLLESGYEVVVIEPDWANQFVPRAVGLNVPVVVGDAREPAVLRHAGLMRARAVVAVINGDLLDIEIALAARAERPGVRVILRAFNEELDRNLERAFGPESAFSTSGLAAPTLAAAAVSREIEHVLPLGDNLLGVAQVVVRSDGDLRGPITALETSCRVRVLHRQDASGHHLTRKPTSQLNAGDCITVLGMLSALEAVRVRNLPGAEQTAPHTLPPQHPTDQLDTVLVCGLGKVGYRVVQWLYAREPRPRIVVVHSESIGGETGPSFTHYIADLDGVQTIIGDARDPEVLKQAGIERAYSVAALTSDDLTNLQIGLAARQERADVHVVLRVFSDALAEKLVDLFGIHTAYSTSELASQTLAAAAVLGRIRHAFFAAGHLFAADEMTVRAGDRLSGKSVDAIRAQYSALVIGLHRKGESSILPDLEAVVGPGDEVTLLAPLDALGKVRES